MRFEDYRERFECARLSREDGILEVSLHTAGSPLVWGAGPHRELPEAFEAIASDPQNQVVIISGTGESFCADRDETLSILRTSPYGWDQIYREGRRMLETLLAIEAPVVGAVNGPALYHAELVVLSDIVLAADTATFQDRPHFISGVVPGDGVQVVWPMLLGANRGRYFLLTGQELSATEALELGIVSEVLPPDRLLARARELAAQIASRPELVKRYTRIVLVEQLRRMMSDALPHGLSLEGAALLAGADEDAKEVSCPACGALIEAPDDGALVRLAREHTRDAHGYEIPTEHVLAASRRLDTGEAHP
jgi:enoyl-CoA hydratase/carnithine racemase